MSAPLRALVVGADGDEIAALATLVAELVGRDCDLRAIEVDSRSVDLTVAWGTEYPRSRR